VALAVFLDEVEPFDRSDGDENAGSTTVRERALSLLDCDVDGDVVRELLEEYRQAKAFITPLRVENGVLSNGYHRLAALLMAGAEYVEIWVVRGGVYEHDYSHPVSEASFVMSPKEGMYIDAWEEFCTYALWAARSLATSYGWIESDGGSLCTEGGSVIVTYGYYASVDVVRRGETFIVARLDQYGIKATLRDVVVQVTDDE
jgi:hypothetical protein